jgi:hypothetical protein
MLARLRGICHSAVKVELEGKLYIIAQLGRFAMKRKKFWLLPLMILAVVYGALAIFTKASVLAPFIYTLF